MVVGIVLLIAAGLLATWHQVTSLDNLVMVLFFGLATAGAVSFVTIREPIYAALGFATTILSSCGILFMQYAYFVSAATMIVYAGATIIIFLFVLMFAQQGHLQTYDLKLNTPLVSGIIAAVVLGLIYYSILNTELVPVTADALSTRPHSTALTLPAPSRTAELGRGLYTDYLFTVEIAGTLLLVATIGAISVASRSAEADTP